MCTFSAFDASAKPSEVFCVSPISAALRNSPSAYDRYASSIACAYANDPKLSVNANPKTAAIAPSRLYG